MNDVESAATVSPSLPGRLAYLSLEVLLPGSAAHTHVTEMIAGLEARGWQVARFLARPAGSSSSRLPIRRIPEHCRVLVRCVRQIRNVDVLYIRSHPFSWPAAWMARRAGVIVVHEINGIVTDLTVTYPLLRNVEWLLRAMQWSQFRMADALFAVTPGLVDYARQLSTDRPACVVPNGANLRMFRPDGPRYAHRRRYVVFIGSLARWHGIDTMMEALRNPAWPADIDLLIAGEGMEGPSLAAAEGTLRNLVWLRRQAYEALPGLLRGASAALIPIGNPEGRSNHGVLPLKLFEAMACGTPVIVTDLPGQAELVRKSQCGVVVPLDDPASLAQAVAELCADRQAAEQMGTRGAAEAHRAHGWQHRANAVHDVLVRLRERAVA